MNEIFYSEEMKGFEQKQLFNTIAQVNAEGIYVIANYIFGLPEEDLAAMQRTLDEGRQEGQRVLAEAREGQVFVRVAPPHGSIAASVLHRRRDGSSVRSEIDKTGGIRSIS